MQSAGFIYLLVAHVGAVALAVMFLALASGSGSFDFASFHAESADVMKRSVMCAAVM